MKVTSNWKNKDSPLEDYTLVNTGMKMTSGFKSDLSIAKKRQYTKIQRDECVWYSPRNRPYTKIQSRKDWYLATGKSYIAAWKRLYLKVVYPLLKVERTQKYRYEIKVLS